jgi:tetraprenyl-beta-curcumene synthase
MLPILRTLTTLTLYEAIIVPHARSEIRRWADLAQTIPNPELRAVATAAVADDAGNAEAAAAFGAFAPRRSVRTVVELLVAWQILIDYVDALGEIDHADPLSHGLELGAALTATIAEPLERDHLERLAGNDGGYLSALIDACRKRLNSFPAVEAVRAPAAAAARRCGAALAHTHAAAHAGETSRLEAWADVATTATSYAWWEIAAGGNSNIGVLALLAVASDPASTVRDADAVAAAYWPHVCTMSTLLDSLVDYERDAHTGNFSFVGRYADRDDAERGIVAASARSLDAVQQLRRSHTHAMIVCGVAAFYGAEAKSHSLAAQITPKVLMALRPTATPIAAALRAQRRLKRRTAESTPD